MEETNEKTICECAICSLNLPFDFDTHLIAEIEKYNCVIFAGAGISTETGLTHPNTLFEEIQDATGHYDEIPFQELVDRHELQPNGRKKLIELICNRFDYINSFRDLKSKATSFHRELSDMIYFQTIITTNWDLYFEEFLGATPFVYDHDMPFWVDAKRPVLKIHGSIDNFSSIIASSEDYKECEKRLRDGALGATLKQIFATKTCIFCGYSASDPDFQIIYRTVMEGMGKFAHNHYLVSPFLTDNEINKLKSDLNIIGIKTDATNFLATVRKHMETKFCFAKKDSYSEIIKTLYELYDVHERFVASYNPFESQHLVFCTVYQDGLIHAFQRILDLRHKGEYSDLHYVQQQIFLYDEEITKNIKKRNYNNVSYFYGYMNGLIYFLCINSDHENTQDLPMFFHPGVYEMDAEEFENKIRNNPEIHKSAFKEAKKLIKKMGDAGDVVIQRLPWG